MKKKPYKEKSDLSNATKKFRILIISNTNNNDN